MHLRNTYSAVADIFIFLGQIQFMESTGKTVLITGASRGIGFGLVKEYSKRGFKVLATCRDPFKAKDLASFLAKNHHPEAFACDVSLDSSIESCLESIEKNGIEKIDVLVNNAGISNKDHPDDPATESERQECVDIYNTNVAGPLIMTKKFKELIEKAEKPVVINISSLMGSSTSRRFNTTSYQCSKAGLNMLTKCQASAMPKIKFVAVHPGWVQSDMGSSKNRSPPVTIEKSAQGIIDVVDQVKESGSFWSFNGKELPY